MNAQHLKMTPPSARRRSCVKPFLAERGWTLPGDDEWLARMAATLQERAKTLVDLLDQGAYYFTDAVTIDPSRGRASTREGESRRAARPARRAGGAADWTTTGIQARVRGGARPPLAGARQARPAGARRPDRRHRQPGDLRGGRGHRPRAERRAAGRGPADGGAGRGSPRSRGPCGHMATRSVARGGGGAAPDLRAPRPTTLGGAPHRHAATRAAPTRPGPSSRSSPRCRAGRPCG